MDFARFSASMLDEFGVSIAGLFLVLAVCVAIPTDSKGIWFELFRVTPPPPCCVEGNYVVAQVKSSKSVQVSETLTDPSGAARMVAAKMERRVERAVYLTATDGTSVQEVAGFTADLASGTEELHIGLITNQQLVDVSHSYKGQVYADLDQLVWPHCSGVTYDHIPILAGCK
jgi:hypothetical protein